MVGASPLVCSRTSRGENRTSPSLSPSLKHNAEEGRPLPGAGGPLCRADREAIGEGEESVRQECEGLPLGTVSTRIFRFARDFVRS